MNFLLLFCLLVDPSTSFVCHKESINLDFHNLLYRH